MKQNKKPKLLFIVQTPPPVHGASVINKLVLDNLSLNKYYKINFIRLNFGTSLIGIGKFSFSKFLYGFKFFFKVFLSFFRSYQLVYLNFAPLGLSLIRYMLLLFLYKKILCKKMVIHLHGKGLYRVKGVKKHILKWLFSDLNIICLSKSLTNDICELSSKSKIFILNNGVSVTNTEYKRFKNNTKLLYLSNLKLSKGIKEFIISIGNLVQKGLNVQGIIVGKETTDFTQNDLQNFIDEHNVNKNIIYKGALYGDEKNKILNDNCILVFPTYYKNEAFPLVLLEAMGNGLPIITSSEGGILDIIKDKKNGLIIDPKSTKDIEHAMERLLYNEELMNQISIQNIIEYKEKYSLEIFEKNLLEIFDNILK